MDKLNQRYGLNALSLAITGRPDASWKVRKDFPTPNYLTDIDQIMTVQL